MIPAGEVVARIDEESVGRNDRRRSLTSPRYVYPTGLNSEALKKLQGPLSLGGVEGGRGSIGGYGEGAAAGGADTRPRSGAVVCTQI